MYAADHHSSAVSRAVGIARELAVAVVLSLVVVTTAGGINDASMRISVVVAAIYLTAAEVRRQLPDLAAYALSPFKRFVASLLEPVLETIRLSITRALQRNAMEPASRLNLPATPQTESAMGWPPVRQDGHDEFGKMIHDLTQLRLETERHNHSVLDQVASWRHELQYRDKDLATRVLDLTERTIAAEKHVRLLADKIDRLLAALDHSSSAIPGEPRVEPINLTQKTVKVSDAVDTEPYRNWLEHLQASELRITAAFTGSGVAWKLALARVDDLALWADFKTLPETASNKLLPRRDIISGLPTIYHKQFDILHAIRTDPAAFKRLLDELLDRLTEIDQR